MFFFPFMHRSVLQIHQLIKMCNFIVEFLHILGRKGRHGDSSEDLWDFFSGFQDVERLGEIPGGSQEPGSSQTGTGMLRKISKAIFKYAKGDIEI